jgi:hypothetical protein
MEVLQRYRQWPQTLAKAGMLGNADVACPSDGRFLALQSNRICGNLSFVAEGKALVCHITWSTREMAMSELKQQSIALWILLMLLILVPWALE